MPLDDDARRRAAETKRERTRQKLLSAVEQLMIEGIPPWEITHTDVSELSGMSQATVFRYFPTIKDLRRNAMADLAYVGRQEVNTARLLAQMMEPLRALSVTERQAIVEALRELMRREGASHEVLGLMVLQELFALAD